MVHAHGRGGGSRATAVAAGLVAALVSTPAAGEVIEIALDGSVIVLTARPDAPPAAGLALRDMRKAALAPAFERSGAETALSPALLEAVAWAESRFNPTARSPRGAIGAMQLMPGAAADMGVDPHDPTDNVRGGARYLRYLMSEFSANIELALAAYNAGPETVRRYGGTPPYKETRAYVAAVLDYMAERAEAAPAAKERAR
ncbi:MAG: lytic transglycosylase domain-containing protein [Hyphomonadaceae bacterium]|nr:lytic transglycosylase domain-containing protein [Hyphomonadaceae bacterium]